MATAADLQLEAPTVAPVDFSYFSGDKTIPQHNNHEHSPNKINNQHKRAKHSYFVYTLVAATYALWLAIPPATLSVTYIYWAYMGRWKWVTLPTFAAHGINAILTAIDLFVSNLPVPLLGAWGALGYWCACMCGVREEGGGLRCGFACACCLEGVVDLICGQCKWAPCGSFADVTMQLSYLLAGGFRACSCGNGKVHRPSCIPNGNFICLNALGRAKTLGPAYGLPGTWTDDDLTMHKALNELQASDCPHCDSNATNLEEVALASGALPDGVKSSALQDKQAHYRPPISRTGATEISASTRATSNLCESLPQHLTPDDLIALKAFPPSGRRPCAMLQRVQDDGLVG